MAVFKVKAKNRVDIDKKPRVYFTCHPDDFERYFKKVCDDIFKTHDCAIYYTEDMTEVIAEDEKQVDLGRNNLFVVPVTFKLLTTPNRAMDEDIPYALKEHIPVLPIMMEPGIDKFYSKPDKFGELQYLNPYSTDLTEISYEEKLKKYLESVLISDELAKRVRAAFDAYIFLSYRKKDRKYANELMRLIHSIPECRDIAIWFDEFLTPGESFKENIEKILDDCKLFTLLITPQLLEKVVDENGEERDNYVISTELPLARKKKEEKGTDIFAVEMEKTNRESLSSISIEDYTNPQNADFRVRLLETISRMAITTNNTPEHNFLIGLAYLEGIDVEVDRERALELITGAAKADLPEAIKKLVTMYHDGVGVNCNYEQGIKWQKRAVQLFFEASEKKKDDLSIHIFLSELLTLGRLLNEIGKTIETKKVCIETQDRAYILFLDQYSRKTIDITTLNLLIDIKTILVEIYNLEGDFNSAKKEAENIVQIAKKLDFKNNDAEAERKIYRGVYFGIETAYNPGNFSFVVDNVNDLIKKIQESCHKKNDDSYCDDILYDLFSMLGNCYFSLCHYSQATEYFENALSLAYKLDLIKTTNISKRRIAISLSDLGKTFMRLGNITPSKEYYLKAMKIHEEIFEKETLYRFHKDLCDIYLDLVLILLEQDDVTIEDIKEAECYCEKAKVIVETMLKNSYTEEADFTRLVLWERCGKICQFNNNLSEAIDYFCLIVDLCQSRLSLSNNFRVTHILTSTYCNLAFSYIGLNMYKEAHNAFSEGKKTAQILYKNKSISMEELVELYDILIDFYRQEKDESNLIICLEELLQVFEDANELRKFQQKQFLLTYQLGNIGFLSQNYALAENNFKKALIIGKELMENDEITIGILQNMALIYEKMSCISEQEGDLKSTEYYSDQALYLFKGIRNLLSTEQTEYDLAFSYYKSGLRKQNLKKKKEAQKQYEQAIEVVSILITEQEQCDPRCYFLLAEIYQKLASNSNFFKKRLVLKAALNTFEHCLEFNLSSNLQKIIREICATLRKML